MHAHLLLLNPPMFWELLEQMRTLLIHQLGKLISCKHPNGWKDYLWMYVWNVIRTCFSRFGFGRFTTLEEVEYTAQRVMKHVERLREMRYRIIFTFYQAKCQVTSRIQQHCNDFHCIFQSSLGDAPRRHWSEVHPMVPALVIIFQVHKKRWFYRSWILS